MFGLLNSHHRRDQSASLDHDGDSQLGYESGAFRLSGLTFGTRVATALGWRPVEAITVGDQVMTFDNGLQMVVAVTRAIHHPAAGDLPAFAVPIHVPIGAIDNDEPLVLLPEQIVMLESDAAETMTGDPFALVPAKALEGFRGVDRIRGIRPVEVISLHFENDEVIYVEGGALLLAPSAIPGIVPLDLIEVAGGLPAPYMVHRGAAALNLIAAIAEEDARAFAAAHGIRAA